MNACRNHLVSVQILSFVGIVIFCKIKIILEIIEGRMPFEIPCHLYMFY